MRFFLPLYHSNDATAPVRIKANAEYECGVNGSVGSWSSDGGGGACVAGGVSVGGSVDVAGGVVKDIESKMADNVTSVF
ncbi:Hypothetical predicted protein [Octopus vulgaris]|uniref:Uncharacterized protein n=1 Tax=Octopus vulgaris TaxID=6645 RepID=A0AA36BSI7_OCTVU|nr:Hypothetical predicted protein [Octopus vulgaris]